MSVEPVARALRGQLRDDQLLTDPVDRLAYDCDGLTTIRSTPGLVVLPESAEQVVAVVRACARHGVPFVPRGAGTGLSGGAVAGPEAVVVALARMRRIVSIDPLERSATVEPGVGNAELSAAAARYGLYFAPDPSSQQVCTIGGNVAENSGGAHCLKYGFTTHHVLGVELVLSTGELVEIGGVTPDRLGAGLVGGIVGSEGTLGVVTKVTVRLLRRPAAVATLLAAFANVESAGAAVSAIIAGGIVPAAVELMDRTAIAAVEAKASSGYPSDADAVLIVELDGHPAEVEIETAMALDACVHAGATSVRRAADDAERARIWVGRKSAFAAMGRISPNYVVQDGVVPRTALTHTLARIGELARDAGLRVANVFHAGDGNLHPLVLFDGAVPGQAERAESVSGAILDVCLEAGGSVTGEHGVGLDKREHLARMFGPDDLAAMGLLRQAMDPAGLANPGKIFPTPRMCGESRRGAAA